MTQAPQTPIPASTQPPAPVAPGKNTQATIGMILGILATATSWTAVFIFPCVLPLGTGIAALILSILGDRTAKANGVGAGKAKVGLILSIVGLAIAIVFLIWGIIAWVQLSRGTEQMWERAREMDPSQL